MEGRFLAGASFELDYSAPAFVICQDVLSLACVGFAPCTCVV